LHIVLAVKSLFDKKNFSRNFKLNSKTLNILDIGGGFRSSDKNEFVELFDSIAASINETLDAYFPQLSNSEIKVNLSFNIGFSYLAIRSILVLVYR
jgi:hypothetical protein